MIIMSNHEQSGGLLQELRETTLQSQQDKLYLWKERFVKMVKSASRNGKSNINFIVISNKFGKEYITEELLEDFRRYLRYEGFRYGDWKYINEEDICEPFYVIEVSW